MDRVTVWMDGRTETGLTRTPAVSDTLQASLVSGQRPFSSSGRTITADHLDIWTPGHI